MDAKKILIVEDDPDIIKGMAIRLRVSNYDTFSAMDAKAAVEQTIRHLPDLILLDLGLSGSGDGFTVMDRLKTDPDLASIPVIVISGRSSHENRARALTAGATAFFEKPARNDELMAAIRLCLGQPPLPVKTSPIAVAAVVASVTTAATISASA